MLKIKTNFEVDCKNRHLFGIKNIRNTEPLTLSACKVLAHFSTQCGAQYPDRLRGTMLRKQLTTQVINLDMTADGLADIAQFMGHSSRIQREFYFQDDGRKLIMNITKALEEAT